jgi:hypothetical protein
MGTVSVVGSFNLRGYGDFFLLFDVRRLWLWGKALGLVSSGALADVVSVPAHFWPTPRPNTDSPIKKPGISRVFLSGIELKR